YIAGLSAACTLAAVWIHVWQPGPPSWYDDVTTRERMKQLRSADQWQLAHAEYVLNDTVVAVLPKMATGVFVSQASYVVDPVDSTKRFVETQLGGAQGLRARVGIVFHEAALGRYGKSNVYSRTNYFTGQDAIGPYCVTTFPLTTRNARLGIGIDYGRHDVTGRLSNLTGPCQFWARYGAPGAGVEGWLRQGGYHFASAPVAILPSPEKREWQPFGIDWRNTNRGYGRACRAGDEVACGRALNWRMEDDTMRIAAFTPDRRYDYQPRIGDHDEAMFAHVEQEFGAAKFDSFWHSTEPVDVAFRNAFGVSLNAWTMKWSQEYFGVATRGPRIAGFSVFLTVLLLAALASAVPFIAKYRAVA
ncbi:MAG: hypothetical protein ABIV28_03510, partial [Longimicrobiales bacterium]